MSFYLMFFILEKKQIIIYIAFFLVNMGLYSTSYLKLELLLASVCFYSPLGYCIVLAYLIQQAFKTTMRFSVLKTKPIGFA